MSLLMDVPELLYGIMGINLGGGQTAVSQQLFDRVQVCPVIHQVGGKTMSEHVWTFLIKRTGFSQHLVYQCPGIPRIKLLPFFSYQQRFPGLLKFLLLQLLILPDGGQ